MIKGREQTLARLSTLMQVGLSVACYWVVAWAVTTYLRPVNIDVHDNNTIYLLIIAIWYTLIKELNLGKMLRVKTYSELFAEYFALVVISSGLLHLGSLFLTDSVPTLILALFACLNLVVLFGFRMLSYRIFKLLRGKGFNTRNVLIVADDESYLHFIDRMLFIRDWGYNVWAIMSDGKHIKNKYESHVRVLHEHFQLSEIIDANVVDEVIYCKGKFDNEEVRALIYACSEVGVTFRVYSELLSVVSQRSHLTYFKELPFLTFANNTKNYFALKVKEMLDFLFSFVIVVLISPVLLAISVAIKIEDGGSVFFRQRRVGLNGRIFHCLKFRTMVENAEALRVKLENQNACRNPKRIKPQEHSAALNYQPVLFSELDVNKHFNSVKALERVLDQFGIEFLNQFELSTIEINYLKEGLAGDSLAVDTTQLDENCYSTTIVRESDGIDLCCMVTNWRKRSV